MNKYVLKNINYILIINYCTHFHLYPYTIICIKNINYVLIINYCTHFYLYPYTIIYIE